MLYKKACLPRVEQRIEQLSFKYLNSTIDNNNPLIKILFENVLVSSGRRKNPIETIDYYKVNNLASSQIQ